MHENKGKRTLCRPQAKLKPGFSSSWGKTGSKKQGVTFFDAEFVEKQMHFHQECSLTGPWQNPGQNT